jgi:predicted metal-dependent phosphoesterase TrpH
MERERAVLRVDLHSHTWYSGDSLTSPETLVRRARAAGLDRIAVTDHGAIEGAFAARGLDPELVIVGEEIRCGCGTDVIGLFLQELIPVGLSLRETASRIREQGGVVYAPHPFAYLTRPKRRAADVLAVADVAEVFNSRAVYGPWNRRAVARTRSLGLPGAFGSDSHMPWEVGRASCTMPVFNDAGSFLESVRSAQPADQRLGTVFLHAFTLAVQGTRWLAGQGHGTPLRKRASRRRGSEVNA